MRRHVPVTVLIPAYNAHEFLKGAIDTVRAQSVLVDEIIVIDDESSDNTAAVAEQLGARVLREPHRGLAGTRNAGIRAATSEWIATLDADDFWHPRKLEFQYDAVVAKPDLGLVFSDFDAVAFSDGRIQQPNVITDDHNFPRLKATPVTPYANHLDSDQFLQELAARSCILPSTALFRRSFAMEIGGFPIDVKAEDAAFFLRLVSRMPAAFVHLPLVAYMRHDSQITGNWDLDSVRLELYNYVLARQENYHKLVISSLKKQYATLLYRSAATAAAKRQMRSCTGLLLKALGVAISRGELLSLARSIAMSKSFRSRLGRFFERSDPGSIAPSHGPYVDGVEIPWRSAREHAATSGA